VSKPLAVLDVSALFEETWTGIPNVVAAITERALEDDTIDWRFTYETVPVSEALVRDFLRQRSGAGGLQALSELVWTNPAIPRAEAARAVAIFPNIKPVNGYFGKEAMIIHDLSPITTPQFHNKDNIDHFANRIRESVETTDHFFCVSRATETDMHAYFGTPEEKTSVIRLGVDFDPAELSAGLLQVHDGARPEPYVVVIGTLEPRKNGGILFDFLMQNPGFASQYRILFVGRDGWLDEKKRLMSRLDGAGVSPDRIHFTGFVSNTERTALILNSAFCIYPSFFEGFGLPVLEAGALGKLTVCSNSSSIPEVFPEQCVFFDPSDLYDFAQAMRVAELRAAQSRSSAQSLEDILQRAEPHSWAACYTSIADWVRSQ
jgi:glycosyltransferase involved in cell wall biosynthesis